LPEATSAHVNGTLNETDETFRPAAMLALDVVSAFLISASEEP
jgi:hypothetical protein